MSILQEYENIRKEIGEDKYNAIEKYLQTVTTEENYKLYQQESNKIAFEKGILGTEFHKQDQQLKAKYNIVLLSDVLYTPEGWDKFEAWYEKEVI